jgi:hypothetical protein
MKKITVAVVALSLTVSLFSFATAGMGGGCSKCSKQESAPTALAAPPAQAEPFRKFQADTIDLRQEMMNKRFEVQRENLKGTPDTAKIAALKEEIKALQSKILAVRGQSGLPGDKCDGECLQKMGGCDKMNMGDCGKGMGGGCGKGPCGGPQK